MSELDLTAMRMEGVTLTDEYMEIIENERVIAEEYKMQPSYLDRLYGMITDLFIDKYKFKGLNVKNKISSLLEVLDKDKYSYEKLLEFFNQ